MLNNFKCGDSIHLEAEAVLDNLKIVGDYPSSLVMQPFDVGNCMIDSEAECHIDISDYRGSVSLIGVIGKKVRINPNIHAVVQSSWKDILNWNKLDIPTGSFWRNCMSGLVNCDGFFSLPKSEIRKKMHYLNGSA